MNLACPCPHKYIYCLYTYIYLFLFFVLTKIPYFLRCRLLDFFAVVFSPAHKSGCSPPPCSSIGYKSQDTLIVPLPSPNGPPCRPVPMGRTKHSTYIYISRGPSGPPCRWAEWKIHTHLGPFGGGGVEVSPPLSHLACPCPHKNSILFSRCRLWTAIFFCGLIFPAHKPCCFPPPLQLNRI